MNREELLELSRKDNKSKDLFMLEVQAQGSSLASSVMLILALIYAVYEYFTTDDWSPAIYSIISVYNFVFWGYRAIRVESERTKAIIASILWGIFTVLLILLYLNVL
jgi:hypothetical protein